MKKIFITAGLAASAVAFAQTGKVGVNETAPQATLDIKPNATNLAGTTNEGLLIPRLTAARVASIPAASRVEGTLVYVTDAPSNALFNDTTKGYYYYDAAAVKWVKVGSASGTDTSIYTNDGTLTSDRIVNLGAHNLSFTNPGGVGINTTAANGNVLDVNGPTRFLGNSSNVSFQASGSTIDAPDILFKQGPTATHPNNPIGRIWSNPSGAGLLFAGHDILTAPFTTDTQLANSDMVIKPTGELQLMHIANNTTATQVLVAATDGTIGYVDKSTLAGTSTNLYTADGTLSSARTVNQANQNLTFTTGTGQLIVNGTYAGKGAVYQNSTKITAPAPVGSPYVITANDYLVTINNGQNQSFITLPDPTTNVGRQLYIVNADNNEVVLNNTSGTQALSGTGLPSLSVKHTGMILMSNGTEWFNFIGQ